MAARLDLVSPGGPTTPQWLWLGWKTTRLPRPGSGIVTSARRRRPVPSSKTPWSNSPWWAVAYPMPALKPGVSWSGSAGLVSPARMLVQGFPDREGQAFMVMLIGPVIGVRRLGPGRYLDRFRAHPGLAQERVEILSVIEPAVEVEMIYVFLGSDLPDIRVGRLAVIHRPHIGHDEPARADHPVKFP